MCDTIIQLGDFGYWPYNTQGIHFLEALKDILKDIPLYFINGNHEQLDALPLNGDEPFQIQENLFYLPNGYKWEWNSVSFLALGGAYSIDRACGQLDHDWFLEEEITEDQVDKCVSHKEVDIVLTHDAPSCTNPKGLHQKNILEALPNRQKITKVLHEVKPKLMFHGHWHNYYQETVTLYNAQHNCVVTGLNHDAKFENSYKIIDLTHVLIEKL